MTSHHLFAAFHGITDSNLIRRNNIVAGGSVASTLITQVEKYGSLTELSRRQYLEIMRNLTFNDIDVYHPIECEKYNTLVAAGKKLAIRVNPELERIENIYDHYGAHTEQVVYYRNVWHRIQKVSEQYGIQKIDTLFGFDVRFDNEGNYFEEHNFLDTIVQFFDLNCCMVGVSRKGLYIDPRFIEFLRTKTIEISELFTPIHSLTRAMKKSVQWGWKFDFVYYTKVIEIMYGLERLQAKTGAIKHLYSNRKIVWTFGNKYKKALEAMGLPRYWRIVPVKLLKVGGDYCYIQTNEETHLYTVLMDHIDVVGLEELYMIRRKSAEVLRRMMDDSPRTVHNAIGEIVRSGDDANFYASHFTSDVVEDDEMYEDIPF